MMLRPYRFPAQKKNGRSASRSGSAQSAPATVGLSRPSRNTRCNHRCDAPAECAEQHRVAAEEQRCERQATYDRCAGDNRPDAEHVLDADARTRSLRLRRVVDDQRFAVHGPIVTPLPRGRPQRRRGSVSRGRVRVPPSGSGDQQEDHRADDQGGGHERERVTCSPSTTAPSATATTGFTNA